MEHPFNADVWQEVDSSNIKAVGTKGHYLIIQFHKGDSVYRYPNCSNLFSDLCMAKSIGKYFHKEIRNLQYEKLGSEEWPEDESN